MRHTISLFFWGKLLRSLGISTIIFAIGLVVLSLSNIKELKQFTLSRMALEVRVLNGQLMSAQAAASELLLVASKDCDSMQAEIMTAMVSKPSIQSINIIKDNIIICSSYSPVIGYANRLPKDRKIHLLTSDILSPGEVILLTQKSNEKFSVVTTLHGFNFLGLINLLNNNINIRLNTEDGWLNTSDGWLNHANELSEMKHDDDLVVASDKFPFSLSTSISTNAYLHYLLKNELITLLLLTLLSVFGGAYFFYYRDEYHLTQAMKKALKNGEFVPYAQPIMNNQGELKGCEILIRWEHRQGLIQPDKFIPTAEECGLIIPMTLDVIEKVFEECKAFPMLFDNRFHVSINICPHQFLTQNSQELINRCKKILSSEPLKNLRLVLEVTERQTITKNKEIIETIAQLHEIGVKVAIDDFGTGYSTMESLRDFQVDYLKIDKGFIDLIQSDVLNADLVDNMIDLSKRLQIPVIAEGVETQQQADYLIKHQVEFLQGYLYSKPLPLRTFLKSDY